MPDEEPDRDRDRERRRFACAVVVVTVPLVTLSILAGVFLGAWYAICFALIAGALVIAALLDPG